MGKRALHVVLGIALAVSDTGVIFARENVRGLQANASGAAEGSRPSLIIFGSEGGDTPDLMANVMQRCVHFFNPTMVRVVTSLLISVLHGGGGNGSGIDDDGHYRHSSALPNDSE
ncbi:unnamed protein product, partial [Phaeothamnion confervicola]